MLLRLNLKGFYIQDSREGQDSLKPSLCLKINYEDLYEDSLK